MGKTSHFICKELPGLRRRTAGKRKAELGGKEYRGGGHVGRNRWDSHENTGTRVKPLQEGFGLR